MRFPYLYHIHHSFHPEDLPFWLDLVSSLAGPVLELGCGTGRVLSALANAGHLPWGIELERAMLAALRQFLPGPLQTSVHLIQGDFCRLPLAAGHFHLVYMPCNTYSTLSAEQRQAVLTGVSRCLVPGGTFAAGIPNPTELHRLPSASTAEVEETFPHPEDGALVQVSSSWERKNGVFQVTWTYDHLLPGGQVDQLSVQVQHQLAPTRQYLAELSAAGFAQVQTYGDYDRSAYHRSSPYLILVAQQPGFLPA